MGDDASDLLAIKEHLIDKNKSEQESAQVLIKFKPNKDKKSSNTWASSSSQYLLPFQYEWNIAHKNLLLYNSKFTRTIDRRGIVQGQINALNIKTAVIKELVVRINDFINVIFNEWKNSSKDINNFLEQFQKENSDYVFKYIKSANLKDFFILNNEKQFNQEKIKELIKYIISINYLFFDKKSLKKKIIQDFLNKYSDIDIKNMLFENFTLDYSQEKLSTEEKLYIYKNLYTQEQNKIWLQNNDVWELINNKINDEPIGEQNNDMLEPIISKILEAPLDLHYKEIIKQEKSNNFGTLNDYLFKNLSFDKIEFIADIINIFHSSSLDYYLRLMKDDKFIQAVNILKTTPQGLDYLKNNIKFKDGNQGSKLFTLNIHQMLETALLLQNPNAIKFFDDFSDDWHTFTDQKMRAIRQVLETVDGLELIENYPELLYKNWDAKKFDETAKLFRTKVFQKIKSQGFNDKLLRFWSLSNTSKIEFFRMGLENANPENLKFLCNKIEDFENMDYLQIKYTGEGLNGQNPEVSEEIKSNFDTWKALEYSDMDNYSNSSNKQTRALIASKFVQQLN